MCLAYEQKACTVHVQLVTENTDMSLDQEYKMKCLRVQDTINRCTSVNRTAQYKRNETVQQHYSEMTASKRREIL